MSAAVMDRWQQIERRRHDGLVIVLERLNALYDTEEENEDEIGASVPTLYAFERARDLVIRANTEMQNEFPRGTASIEHDGGIRIEWRRSNREVKLITAAQPGSLEYIYHEENGQHGLDKEISPTLLTYWLDWLTRP